MSITNWNFKRAIGGFLSAVALLTVAGGLVSCTPEVEEADEEGIEEVEPEEEDEED